MKIRLINYTKDATNTLIYTKATRLTLGQETEEKVKAMTPEEQAAELKYMAGTIPSSWEFVHYTFEITGVSRAFTHQFVRTRTGSYAQQTMRMLNVEEFEYVTGPTVAEDPVRKALYDETMKVINNSYNTLIKLGAAIEDARGVLPTNICTNIIAKFSLRTLSEMGKSRTGKRTQDEYRCVINGMLDAVIEVHPWAEDFLRPDKLAPIRFLEGVVEAAKDGCFQLQPEDTIKANKALDQLRKSV